MQSIGSSLGRLLSSVGSKSIQYKAHRLSAVFQGYSTAPAHDAGSKEHIDGLVKGQKIVVFMKGTPDAPKCGFSNAVMQILRMHGVKEFSSHNVLADEKLRQGIKDYSNWPTIPQVYINGEFLGGCDIMIEMHQKGELVEELQKIGIRSALIDAPPTTDK